MCEVKLDSHYYYKQGNGEILIITDMVEYPDMYSDFKSFLKSKGIINYTLVSATKCRTKNFKMTTSPPAYKIFKQCITYDFIQKYNPKVILTIGRALQVITKSDDIPNYSDFEEINFNQTYFYYKDVRVYPLPYLFEFIEKDTFQKFFVTKQLTFVKKYLNNYDIEKQKDKIIDYNLHYVDDTNLFLKEHMNEEKVAWDTETNSLNVYIPDFKVKCLTLSFDGINGYYLPFEKINKRILSQFFSKEREYITAFGKYDMLALYNVGIKNAKVTEDIVLLWHLLNTSRVKNSLKSLSWLMPDCGGYDEQLEEYKEKHKVSDYSKIPDDILFNYATLDSVYTFRLYEKALELKKKQPHIYDTYKRVLIPNYEVFRDIEINGVDLNVKNMKVLTRKYKYDIKVLKEKIEKELGGNVDIDSNQQLARSLEEKGFPELGRSTKQLYINNKGEKVGFYSTGVKILEKWELMGFSIATNLLKYRSLKKMYDSFLGEKVVDLKEDNSFLEIKDSNIDNDDTNLGFLKYIEVNKDSKIHPTYGIGMTDCWRFTCSNPNMQNINSDKEYRKVFEPIDKDWYYASSDIGGCHLKIAGIYSGDKTMHKLFNSDIPDMHSFTSQSIFFRNESFEEVVKKKKISPYIERRNDAKGINFLFIYLGSSFRFSEETIKKKWSKEQVVNYIEEHNLEIVIDRKTNQENLPLTVANDIRDTFFKTFSELKIYLDTLVEDCKKTGYVDVPYGGRRHLPRALYIGKDDNYGDVASLKSQIANAPMLITEAILMEERLIKIYKAYKEKRLKSYICHFMHDDITSMVHKDEVEIVYDILHDIMNDYDTFDIPITSDFSIGKIISKSKEYGSKEELKQFIKSLDQKTTKSLA